MAAAAALRVLPGCLHDDEPEAVTADDRRAAIEPMSEGKSATGRRGAELFYDAGCLNCHTYGDIGSANLGAPDLTGEGELGRGIAWQLRHLRDPAAVVPGSVMPAFDTLPDEDLNAIAVFLEESRG
jgi:cytochrome c oxidase subunit 2